MNVRARRRQRGDRGAVALEFALLAPLLLMLLAGIMQYGLYFWGAQAGTNAAADAVRQLSVGNCLTATQLQSYVSDRLGGAVGDATSVHTAVTYRDSSAGVITDPVVGGNVNVAVTFDVIDLHLPMVPLPGGGAVHRSEDARVEDLVDEGCGA